MPGWLARVVAHLALLSSLLAAAAPAAAEKRVALVIGNSAYVEAGRLVNAPNDAREVAAALSRLGFDVMPATDLTNDAFGRAVQDFVAKAQGADVALFFYAGHALQLGQTNYLMPIDARLADELSVKRETVAAQDIVDLMESAARVNLVFLDACRNNPLAERLRTKLASAGRAASIGRGLGRIDTKGRDTLIVFSAEAGAEALDTAGGSHSPFAAGLLAHMETPGLEIEVMLKDVTKSVRDATGGKQQPERLSRLESKFYFKREEASSGVSSGEAAELSRLKAEIDALKKTQQAMLAPAPATGSDPAGLTPGKNDDTKPGGTVAPAEPGVRPAGSDPALTPGTVFRDCLECPEMVVVPAGSFTMGSSPSEIAALKKEYGVDFKDEGPTRSVTIARPFAVGKLEVTRDEFEAFVKETGHSTGDECGTFESNKWKERSGRSFVNPGYAQGGNHPVVCVNWDDAKAYVGWLSQKSGKSYRLLTEAEWEYATRAGTTTRYSYGNGSGEQCGYANGADQTAKALGPPKDWTYASCKDGYERTAPTGSFMPNAFGLFDIYGNVWEWVEDCYKDSYQGAPSDGSASTPGDCSRRVLRGGSLADGPGHLRSAARFKFTSGYRSDDLGFRVGRTL